MCWLYKKMDITSFIGSLAILGSIFTGFQGQSTEPYLASMSQLAQESGQAPIMMSAPTTGSFGGGSGSSGSSFSPPPFFGSGDMGGNSGPGGSQFGSVPIMPSSSGGSGSGSFEPPRMPPPPNGGMFSGGNNMSSENFQMDQQQTTGGSQMQNQINNQQNNSKTGQFFFGLFGGNQKSGDNNKMIPPTMMGNQPQNSSQQQGQNGQGQNGQTQNNQSTSQQNSKTFQNMQNQFQQPQEQQEEEFGPSVNPRQIQQLKQELKQIQQSLKRADKIVKTKAVQSLGLDLDKAKQSLGEMRQNADNIQSLISAESYEDAMDVIQDFHDNGHPGDIEGTIMRIRDVKNMIKKVKDADVRNSVNQVLQEVVDKFNNGEYRDARETLDEYSDDIMNLLSKFAKAKNINRDQSNTQIQNLGNLIDKKLQEIDDRQGQSVQSIQESTQQ